MMTQSAVARQCLAIIRSDGFDVETCTDAGEWLASPAQVSDASRANGRGATQQPTRRVLDALRVLNTLNTDAVQHAINFQEAIPMKQAPEFLSVGDAVVWRGAWGADPPQLARVRRIELTAHPHQKTGRDVRVALWSLVREGYAVVDLENGHWAYGDQLSPAQTAPIVR